MFRVHHAFQPEQQDEHTDIELHIEDIVTNVEYLDNGWSIGYNVTRQKAGIFPRRNIYPVQEDISSIFPPSKPKKRPLFLEERIEEYVNSDEIVNWWRAVDREALKKAYHQVVHTERHQYKILKGCVGCVAGIVLGVLTFIGLQFALEYPVNVAAVMASIFGFFLVIGLAFSTKCRAVVCLCIPTLTTKSGRLMFSTFAISLLLVGPMTNITNNASELASVSSCAGSLLSEQTEFIRKLAREPYDEFVQGINKTVRQVQNSLQPITDVVRPIQDFLRDVERVRDDIYTKLKNAKTKCQGELDTTNGQCKIKMVEAADNCKEYLNKVIDSWRCAGANANTNRFQCSSNEQAQARQPCTDLLDKSLCAPITTVRASCDGLDILIELTDFREALEDVREMLSTDIEIKDTVTGSVNSNATVNSTVEAIKREFQRRTKVITDIFKYINWIISLSVLTVVVQSYLYLRKYMMNDKHDNHYITDGFVVVDKKRSRKGKWSILPLAPKEAKIITDKRQCGMSRLERRALCTGLLPVLLNIVAGGILIGFDFLLHEAILLSNKYGDVKIDIEENIDVGIDIKEGGLLSTFLIELIGNMRLQSNISHTIDFSQCLPTGTRPEYYFIIVGLAIVYSLMFVTILIQAYGLRLRHTMAGYFYPEREKDRIKFLHRKLLRRRVITVKELKDILMIKRQNKEKNIVAEDFFDDLRSTFGCFNYASECYICEKEPPLDKLNYCQECNSNFCDDCFNITVNKVCPCNPEINLTYDHVTESDFEEDVQEQIVGQYYAYAEALGTGSRDSDFDEETEINGQMGVGHHHPQQRHSAAMFFRQPSLL